jgi:regulator of ribonuclease activity A
MPDFMKSATAATSGWIQTADLSDQYGDHLQVCGTSMVQFGGRPTAAGTVRTVRCREDMGLLKRVTEQDGRGRILVVDGGGSLKRAIFGENIARLAIANGWEGIIINGAVRDVAALAELPLSIKACGITPRRGLQSGTGAIDVPVTFGDTTFRPGAELWSDHDGIVVEAAPPSG